MHPSRFAPIFRGLTRRFILLAGSVGALGLLMPLARASTEDVQAALQKANVYIEIAKQTERVVESWERYASWVNMKTGPTGKERYITYGLYEPYDLDDALKEARAETGKEPRVPKIDAAMTRYIDAYAALAPLVAQASAYYERYGYKTDNAREGQALHKKMVPLAKTFLAERDAMMPELRAFVRDVEQQEVAALETREGRSTAWHVGRVMHTVNRVIDLFPRNRPQPIDSDTLDQMMQSLGPDTPGETFDQIIAGVVPPQNVVIDVTRFGEALETYAETVDAFDRFAAEKSDELGKFKALPRQMLAMLREFHAPLTQSKGREFEGGGQMVGQIVEVYFLMSNTGSEFRSSQLRYLP